MVQTQHTFHRLGKKTTFFHSALSESFTVMYWVKQTHQVGHMDDIWDFATRWRWLPSCADGVVYGDGHARLLLTDGATHQTVAGGNWGKDEEEVSRVSGTGKKQECV